MVKINDTELERLIDNNISNAIKHSTKDSIITVNLKNHNDSIKLEFLSKGSIIKDVSKIFEKNYTENNSAKRSLGLGLSMVKNICQKNDIKYLVNSSEGVNSFTYVFNV